ncbi:potassium transporter Kup [Asticcacaulis taihuensis]|uniref:Probable potassium transport system protein Kup n=1 Tax=Asticcacaulis taihuensis TaxID=260084 RepID=A0A1G4PSX6_9CAUL|nr:potassium transporter Kup [Asticcacaulis taihuensis]SCW35281.1 KUP system potassium uptake protein [Asticcacaulis taihuensis]
MTHAPSSSEAGSASQTPASDALQVPSPEPDAVKASNEAEAIESHGHGHTGFWGLAIGAIGVVFGDIGTSPLYAMREALHHTRAGTNPQLATFGVISLVFWALLLLVTVKYVIFLMRADNKGEGGTLALMALAQKALGRHSQAVFFLGMCGAALFYGDSLITPALSVMSAIEGLKDAPGVGHSVDGYIVPISIVILVALFLVQSKGTAKVARFFGPVMLAWFIVIAGMGVYYVAQKPMILQSLSPVYGIQFLLANGLTGFIILGSVFLVVTGAEALYADMGHFGKRPINMAWLWVVFPCLILNYLGQGALTLVDPTAHENPFWRMVPDMFYWPVMLLATMATVIASQAVITGAYSMTQQAVQLGLMPRIDIQRTSETQAGQIFVPQINTMLMIGVLVLIVMFQSSDKLTSAYGIAVTGTMFISTIMAYIVIRKVWLWPKVRTLALLIPLGIIEAIFMASNLTKFFSGAWMPLAFGLVLILIMHTWTKGTRTLTEKARRDSVSLLDLADMLKKRPPHRVAGTAIFLTSDAELAPVALMHNLKHNKVLHEKNIILTVKTTNTPRVDEANRITIDILNEDFKRITVAYGFMESPNLPRALGLCRKLGLKFDIMSTSFFLGKRNVVPSANSGMPIWQDKLFIFLMKNATNPTEFFHIPPGRVVELGTQVTV